MCAVVVVVVVVVVSVGGSLLGGVVVWLFVCNCLSLLLFTVHCCWTCLICCHW